MLNEKTSLVAVLPDGTEFFEEVVLSVDKKSAFGPVYQVEKVAWNAVIASGLRTTRNNPKSIKVPVYRLVINKGKIHRVLAVEPLVDLPFDRMTEDEFSKEMDSLLKELPPAFREFVSEKSYDDGHSAGYEEVVSIAQGLVFNLGKAIDKYRETLREYVSGGTEFIRTPSVEDLKKVGL